MRDCLPETAGAAVAGQIGIEAAHVIASVATTPIRTAALAACAQDCGEGFLVEHARHLPVGQLRVLARRWAAAADPAADERGYRQGADREFLTLSETTDGCHLKGFLTTEHGHALRAALDVMAGRSADQAGHPARRRRAIALTNLVRTVLDRDLTGATGTHRPHITCVVDLETLTRALGGGRALSSQGSMEWVPPAQQPPPRHDDQSDEQCSDERCSDEQCSDGRCSDRSGSDRSGRDGSGIGGKRRDGPPPATHRRPPRGHVDSGTLSVPDRDGSPPGGPGDRRESGGASARAGHSGSPSDGGVPARDTASAVVLPRPMHIGDVERFAVAELVGSGPIPDSVLARLACDSQLTRVVFGPRSQVLNVGRTERTYTGHKRRAIVARDRHCQFPDCDAPPAMSEIHHTDHWLRDHGDTDVNTGVLVCWYHHDVIP